MFATAWLKLIGELGVSSLGLITAAAAGILPLLAAILVVGAVR